MAIVQSGDYFHEVNFVPSAAGAHREVWWNFTRVLLAAGWTAVEHSDGTTVAAGDWADYTASNNVNAWIIMQDPSGASEFVIQHDPTVTYRSRAYFSPADGFVSTTATARPTAADERRFQCNTNGGSFQTFAGSGAADAASYRWHFCAKAEAGEGGFYYAHILATTVATGACRTGAILAPTIAGPGGDLDTARWVIKQPQGFGELPDPAANLSSPVGWDGYLAHGLAGEAYFGVSSDGTLTQGLGVQYIYPWAFDQAGVDPYTGTNTAVPASVYGVNPASWQHKGFLEDVFLTSLDSTGDFTNEQTTSVTGAPFGTGVLFSLGYIFPWITDATPDFAHTVWTAGRIPEVVPDETAPVVTVVSPAEDTVLTQAQAVVFDVTDETLLSKVVVLASYASGDYEVIHDGAAFATHFLAGSSRTVIAGGYRFSCVRTDGWLEAPTIKVLALDSSHNEAV